MNKERPSKRNMLGTFVIAAIAYIVLGVFMVVKSQAVADGINVVFGVVMLVFGVVNIIAFFLNKDSEANLFLELALGVIALGLGFFSLFAHDLMMKILFYAIGAILIIDGLVNIKRSFNLRSMRYGHWNIFLVAAIIGTVLGILCIIFYRIIPDVIVVFFGISLIYEGLASLIIIFIDSRTRKKINTELAVVEQDID